MTNDQITVSRALLRQAIDALSDTQTDGESPQWDIEKAAYDALRTALEQPAVEPVAWIYQNANTDNEYLAWKKGTGGRNWRPLFTSSSAQETVVGVDYRGMYLKMRDELVDAQQRLDTCEALARSVMNDQVGRA